MTMNTQVSARMNELILKKGFILDPKKKKGFIVTIDTQVACVCEFTYLEKVLLKRNYTKRKLYMY